VLRPTLTDYQGGAWFLSTPKSLNYFYTLFKRGQNDAGNDHGVWKSWQFPTVANPYLPAEEITAAEQELPERTFLQEYRAQFIEDAGAVFRRVLEAMRPCLQKRRQDGHRYVIGVDWARVNDFTVFVVVDTHGALRVRAGPVHTGRIQSAARTSPGPGGSVSPRRGGRREEQYG
jgi:hypothetical protein